MRIKHFERLRPICPVCIDRTNQFEAPLRVESVLFEEQEHIVEGVLQCSNRNCCSEFPIIDGIPIIHPRLRAYVSENFSHIHARHDLSPIIESILGDCCSQGSQFDTMRQHLSCYAWDHYADCDPQEVVQSVRPGSVVRLLEIGLQTDACLSQGPVLDVGCGVGRTTFSLAERTDQLVLGIDLHFATLQLASKILRTGQVRYPRRRIGLVYDQREFAVHFPHSANVDFWACDALALPFSTATFSQCIALNALDSVVSPHGFLTEIARAIVPEGRVLLACPYDWTTSVTPVEAWLGGHSQRGSDAGECSTQLRKLFTDGAHPGAIAELEIVSETDRLPWTLRLHDRSTMSYQVHLINLRRDSEKKIHQD